MGYNKNLLMISSSLIFLIIPIAFSIIKDSELANECDIGSTGSFETNSSYSKSLVNLMNNLRDNISKNHGFWSAWGQDSNSTAYGFAVCPADILQDVCHTCLTNAAIDSRNNCNTSKAAIVVRDYCMLRYSDIDFRGQIDFNIYYNSPIVAANCNNEVLELLKNLSSQSIDPDHFFFSNGSIEAAGNTRVYYAMVQCTRDISADNCGECLYGARTDLSDNGCRNETSLQVVYGSCRLRYETYNFLYEGIE